MYFTKNKERGPAPPGHSTRSVTVVHVISFYVIVLKTLHCFKQSETLDIANILMLTPDVRYNASVN